MADKLNKRNILIVSLACAVLGLLFMFAPFISSSVKTEGMSAVLWASGFALAFGLNAHTTISYGGESETGEVSIGQVYAGFLVIFLIVMVVIALTIFLIVKKEEENKVPVFVLNILMFVLMIMTFCSPAMIESEAGVGLGWGAIIAALLYLVAFLLLSFQSYRMLKGCKLISIGKLIGPSAKEKTDAEQIIELKKMLDDGLITEDQFNRKREVILFGKEPDKE